MTETVSGDLEADALLHGLLRQFDANVTAFRSSPLWDDAVRYLSRNLQSRELAVAKAERQRIVAWLRKEASDIFVEDDLPLTTAMSYMHHAATAIENNELGPDLPTIIQNMEKGE